MTSSRSRRRRGRRPPASHAPALLHLLACLPVLVHTGLSGVTAQGSGGAGSALGSFFSNALSWCTDTTQNPVPPVAASTVSCSSGLPASITLAGGLDNQGLPIPASVSQLSSLTSLNLAQDSIGGSLPQELSLLTSLQSLDLKGNQLTGPLPVFLDTFTTLTFLDLSGNSLYGAVPSANGILCAVAKLSDNCFSYAACTPSSASATPITSKFSAGGCTSQCLPAAAEEECSNPLAGVLASAQRYCTAAVALPFVTCSAGLLQGVDVSLLPVQLDNQGLGLPSIISTFTDLSSLALDKARIGGSIPDSLSLLQALTLLSLAQNDMSGSMPLGLSTLTSMQSLVLSQNSFSGALPPFLGTLDLKTLALSNNIFSGTVPALSIIQSFKLLDLSYNLLYGVVSNKNHPACTGNLDKNCFSFVACPGTGPNNGGQLFGASQGCITTCASAGDVCSVPMSAVVDSVTQYCGTVQHGSAKSGHAGLACLYGSPFMLDVTQFPRTVQAFSNLGITLPDSVSVLTNLAALSAPAPHTVALLPEPCLLPKQATAFHCLPGCPSKAWSSRAAA